MVHLWRRSQRAAQYVCNVLDAGNARMDALLRDHPAASAAKAPQPSAALSTDPASAFWLNGHEVKDLLTLHVAVGTETGALLAARPAAVSTAAVGGMLQKRKPGGPSAAAAKRRRLGDDFLADITAKQQTYVSELLMHIAVGDHLQTSGDDNLLGDGAPGLPTAAEAGHISETLVPTTAHADHAAEPYLAADNQPPDPDKQGAVNHAAVELENTAAKLLRSRDRWSQASTFVVTCSSCKCRARHVCLLQLRASTPPLLLN